MTGAATGSQVARSKVTNAACKNLDLHCSDSSETRFTNRSPKTKRCSFQHLLFHLKSAVDQLILLINILNMQFSENWRELEEQEKKNLLLKG